MFKPPLSRLLLIEILLIEIERFKHFSQQIIHLQKSDDQIDS